MDLDMRGRIVAITGGSRGIGKAIALRLATEGAAIAIAARTVADLEETHRAIEAEGGRCLAYACDLAEPGEAGAFVEAAAATFGGLDGLVCCAGGSDGGGLVGSTRETWEQAFALNLHHAVEALQAAVPALGEAGGAALFVSSISGRKPVPVRWHYAAAKAALIHAAASFAEELGSIGVRVNALAPGSTLFGGGGWARRSLEDPERFEAFVAREMPLGRLADVEEIAAVATFLLSPRSSWINGACIPVDGGQRRPGW